MIENIRKIVTDVEAGRVFSSDFGPMLVALQELAKAQRPSDFSLAAGMFIEGVPASKRATCTTTPFRRSLPTTPVFTRPTLMGF